MPKAAKVGDHRAGSHARLQTCDEREAFLQLSGGHTRIVWRSTSTSFDLRASGHLRGAPCSEDLVITSGMAVLKGVSFNRQEDLAIGWGILAGLIYQDHDVRSKVRG